VKPTIELSEAGRLTLADIDAVAQGRAAIALAAPAKARLAAFRARAEAEIAANPGKKVYGVNTGFGSNFKDEVSADELRALQRNLIISHCACVGPPAPPPVVRATILMRAASLARGRSVVRPIVVETLIDMINADVVPFVPRHGSVSASGDLAPLSHVAAVLIGEGRVLDQKTGEGIATKDYLARAKQAGAPAFAPIALEMKEGLALNNGCQYSNALGALATIQMRRLIEAAATSTALHVQAMRGMGRPFRADLHALRPHPGSQAMARWVFDLLDGYQFQDVTTDEKHAFDGKIQDPYNLRCAAQVLGPCLDLISRAEATMSIEANSVTDNPIDLNDEPDASYLLDNITSGGHFHGMPLAVESFGLLQAAGIMARLSNMRCARIVDAARNKGLGPQVRGADARSTESGLMIAEYTSAGLCNHIWGLAMPSHLMSVSTDSGQEDHVSMAANVALRACEAAERLAEMLAIEMAFAAQAELVRDAEGPKVALGARLGAALREIASAFPPVDGDRELAWDVTNLAAHVLSGDIARATGYDFRRH
jgi:histidine ammonia-lyase